MVIKFSEDNNFKERGGLGEGVERKKRQKEGENSEKLFLFSPIPNTVVTKKWSQVDLAKATWLNVIGRRSNFIKLTNSVLLSIGLCKEMTCFLPVKFSEACAPLRICCAWRTFSCSCSYAEG